MSWINESLQKALRSLETDLVGLDPIDLGLSDPEEISSALKSRLSIQAPDRILVIAQAFRAGFSVEKVQQYTQFDPWFLRQIETLIKAETWLSETGLPNNPDTWRAIKSEGFSDVRIAQLTGETEAVVRQARHNRL